MIVQTKDQRYLNFGLSLLTTPISISDGLKSADRTDDKAVMATCMKQDVDSALLLSYMHIRFYMTAHVHNTVMHYC